LDALWPRRGEFGTEDRLHFMFDVGLDPVESRTQDKNNREDMMRSTGVSTIQVAESHCLVEVRNGD
jgi:hypothetical protein